MPLNRWCWKQSLPWHTSLKCPRISRTTCFYIAFLFQAFRRSTIGCSIRHFSQQPKRTQLLGRAPIKQGHFFLWVFSLSQNFLIFFHVPSVTLLYLLLSCLCLFLFVTFCSLASKSIFSYMYLCRCLPYIYVN